MKFVMQNDGDFVDVILLYRLDDRGVVVLLPAEVRDLFLLQSLQTSSETQPTPPASVTGYWGYFSGANLSWREADHRSM
jgi:Flp pilus assembly protein CpaB